MASVATAGRSIAWKTCTTYPEDWDAYLQSESEIRCPAVWVVFAGWTRAERASAAMLIVDGSFGVMIADQNRRMEEQYQRHGGVNIAAEPGSYRLALLAVTALAGQTLGLDLVTPLEAGALRAVWPNADIRKRGLSMYAVEMTCRFPLTLVGDGESDPAELKILHANWDIPALGDPVAVDADLVAPGTQLADDAHADATDHVSLEND